MAVTPKEARGLQSLFSSADAAVYYLLQRLDYDPEEETQMLGGHVLNAPSQPLTLETPLKQVKAWAGGSAEEGQLNRSPAWFVDEKMTVGKYLLGHQRAFRHSQKIHVSKNEQNLNVTHDPKFLLIGTIKDDLFPNDSGNWEGYKELFVKELDIAHWFD